MRRGLAALLALALVALLAVALLAGSLPSALQRTSGRACVLAPEQDAPEGCDLARWLLGNARDAAARASVGYALMGGGGDNDDAHRWLLGHAPGGDVVVLRASGGDGYNAYLAGLGRADSVDTWLVRSRAAAADPQLAHAVRGAEVVFLAGGDQGNYVRWWKGTPLQAALHDAAARGAAFGGTSAGLAVLGEFSFAALRDTINSTEALADPYDPRVTLEQDFLHLPGLEGLLTDSHFAERDRLGRTLVFLARLVADGVVPQAHEVAVDGGTAALVDGDGIARVVGEGAAYFLRSTGPPQVCEPGKPLTLLDTEVHRVRANDTAASFDLRAWRGNGGLAYRVSAVEGAVVSDRGEGY